MQCLCVLLEFGLAVPHFPPAQDWWSVRLSLVEHGWTPISIHGSSLESGLIPSQIQWKIPIIVDSLRSNQNTFWKKMNSDQSLFSVLVIDSTRQWENLHNILPKKTYFFCMLILYLNIYLNPSIHISALSNHQPISNVSFVQKR